MIKVIVNADDFALDENRTKAILQAYQEGWISTTTAIVTTPWFNNAVDMARGLRLYGNIGLHLNLTEGFPLTQTIRRSPLFCDADGLFNAHFHNTKRHRLYLPKFEQDAVREEIEAQIEIYRQSGLSCWHLDSHHHVHTDLSIAGIVLPLAAKIGFKTVRLSRNYGEGLTWGKRLYKRLINMKLASCKGITPNADFFCNFEDFFRNVDAFPKGCTVEVMTHPLYSRNHQVDIHGELTEFHWDYSKLSDFLNSCKIVQLIDYEGVLSR